jgi:hypothetical protein
VLGDDGHTQGLEGPRAWLRRSWEIIGRIAVHRHDGTSQASSQLRTDDRPGTVAGIDDNTCTSPPDAIDVYVLERQNPLEMQLTGIVADIGVSLSVPTDKPRGIAVEV